MIHSSYDGYFTPGTAASEGYSVRVLGMNIINPDDTDIIDVVDLNKVEAKEDRDWKYINPLLVSRKPLLFMAGACS